MTHYRMLDRAPSVVITSNRNELKLYQGNVVYLNDGDNFELRFFNPLTAKIGVEIMFNGIKKGDSYLVLNPGQDIILDRFLDEQRKMLFETYVVNGESKEAIEAIQENGIITFNFYKEYFNSYNNYKQDVNINYDFPPKPYRVRTKNKKGLPHYGNIPSQGTQGPQGPQGTKGVSGSSGTAGASGTSGSSVTLNGSFSTNSFNQNSRIYTSSTFISPGVFTSESDQSYVSHDSLSDMTGGSNNAYFHASISTTCMTTELETGRIEMGDLSNQQLKTVNAQFAATPFHTVTYKILPYSAMNRTVGEVRQYCSCCGYRLRKETWVYCPKCGSELK